MSSEPFFPSAPLKCSHPDGRNIVRNILLERRNATKERITWQIDSERKGIFTLNEEDLYSYKTEFVSACKEEISTMRTRDRPAADSTDPTLSIMGSVRGYFHGRQNGQHSWFPLNPPPPLPVSHRRFLDNVPLAINHELIYGLVHPDRGGLNDVLYRRLGIDGAGADAQCEKLLQEPPNVGVAREELSARYERLSAAGTALETAM